MELGSRIRALRAARGITQEQLAAEMHVTGQAVSKWENGMSTPDIELLPLLSVYFGVTIDELFSMTDEAHMERIRNMINDEKVLSQRDFDYAETFLTEHLRDERCRVDCLELLCDLHNHRAHSHSERAAQYAREGLRLAPERKALHSGLCEAARGANRDWWISNHHDLIEFYKRFTAENPDYGPGWQWMADNLIADRRLDEAREAVEQMGRLMPGYRYSLYMGLIDREAGEHEKALERWRHMLDENPDDWGANLFAGDCLAGMGCWDGAVEHYNIALKLQPKPRYTDAPRSIAHIREIQGRYAEAARAMEDVVALLESEWGVRTGEGHDAPLRERNRYLELARAQAQRENRA